MKNKNLNPDNSLLYDKVLGIIRDARSKIYSSINILMIQAYWSIGKNIVEEEQSGKERADYGKEIVASLAKRLKESGEKGFEADNLWKIRRFYLTYPILDALRPELTWTHYRILLRVDTEEKRNFYETECIKSRWSTRELERQISTLLYERLYLSRDKNGVLKLSEVGAEPSQPSDILKDPFVLEFTGIKENSKYLEKDLEGALINHLKSFLLELGRGFSFVSRQKRITLNSDHFYIDLVFYHYILKCFVLVDLKVNHLTHQDLGQMQMYVNYYDMEISQEGDNPTIGIVLCAEKNDAVVKYFFGKDSQNIFASKYKLNLPTEDELKKEILHEKEILMIEKKLKEDT